MAKKRKRRTNSDIFLEELQKLSGVEQKLIGNISLRGILGWDEDRYQLVRDQLVDQNRIIVGRGKGGSVALAEASGTKALKVFVSYSHQDEKLKTKLMSHLEPLQRQNLIVHWHDRKLAAGVEWETEISKKLEDAEIILLLISIDFINSTYCYDIELERALERHDANEAKVVPIILRHCLWHHTPFAKLQALPKDAKAIAAWADEEEALVNVAEGISSLARDLMGGR